MKKIIYIAGILLIASCGKKAADKKTQLADLKKQRAELDTRIARLESQVGKTDSVRTADVSAITVSPKTFTSYVEVQGTIDADENVMANAETPGVITAIYVHLGQKVNKGQVLVQLDNKALQQQIAAAQTQVELANSLYERQKNLWDQKIGTEVQYIQAKTNRDVAVKQLAGLKAQAAMYAVKAPISGTVDQMDLKVGQLIQPGVQGIRIVNLDKLKAKAAIAETYAGQVTQGDQVIVEVPDAGDSIKTTLTYVARVIDPASRSFTAEVKLPARKNLKPNMTAVLHIVKSKINDAIVVPLKAIQSTQDGQYVYIAQNNNVAKRVRIQTGDTYGGQTVVMSGINAGDKIITEGAQDLEDGDRIHIAG